MRDQDLFSPGRLGRYTLPHRMIMAPMTRNRAGDGGVPTALNVDYYRQRASAALIVTEANQVSPRGTGYPSTPGIHDPRQVEGWRRVTAAVHEAGGRIFLQLWHAGRISHPMYQGGGRPVGPSAVKPAGQIFTAEGLKDFVEPRALDAEEVAGLVNDFRVGARHALEAGCDGVEIHGANGYVFDQFLRDGTNRRSDRYGGTLEKRLRFPLEVTEAVAEVWGADRVGVRLSPLSRFNDMYDSDPRATFTRAAERLGELGLAYLHVVEGNEFEGRPESFDVSEVRDAFGGTYVANHGYTLERARRTIRTGAADFIAFGKLFLANPDLPRRFREGAPLNEPDARTFYGGDERGYTDYPALEEAAQPGTT